MGAPIAGREETDRQRTVKVRSAGNPKTGYRAWTLIVPTWLVREITGKDDQEQAHIALQGFEFEVERTDEGILYHAIRLERKVGW